MATQHNVIDLNGIKYDALTGAVLGKSQPAERHVQHVQVRQHPAPGMRAHRSGARAQQRGMAASMDGMVRQRQPSTHLAAHQTQPTKTLMRRAVKPPQAAALTAQKVKAIAPLNPGVPASAVMKSRLSVNSVDPLRARRASEAQRSTHIRRFSATPSTIQPAMHTALTPVTVQIPSAASNSLAAAQPVTPRTQPLTNRQRLQQQAAAVQQPRPNSGQQRTHTQRAQDDEDHDIFAQALAHATSHEEPAPKESPLRATKRRGKKYRRVLGVAASAAVFLALCGFVAYQNKTNIQLQLASAKAGFSASIPLYKPAGYTMDKLRYATGAVAVSYQNGGQGTFNITQKKSNWDSQTLLENFVATSNESYQGYQAGGRTIYVYGTGKATWVNGGIWYQISGADKLSNDQIVKIAASM